jgi:L-alanine-DL-glutamate epimerase-like enolase superfamily enzyme
MRITAVTTFVTSMPLLITGEPPTVSGQARSAMETLLVRIDTDSGITGWGEAFGHRVWPATRTALDRMIAPLCIGRDPTAIAALMHDLARAVHGAGRNGPLMYALSAIDIGLWDIAGKIANRPLYQLLGGSPRADLPAYASLLRYGKTSAMAPRIAEALERGYKLIKIHEIEPDIIRAARRAAGANMPLMVDCNCPWTVAQAVAICRELRDLKLEWIEEPVWPPEDHAGIARVRAEGGIAVAVGENVGSANEFQRLFERGALDVAQPSITKVGGVTEMQKVFALGEAHGVRVVPHSAYFGPGLLASIHACAAQAQETWVERFYCDFAENPLGDAINPENGRIAIPQGPGLGVDPDPVLLKKLLIEH